MSATPPHDWWTVISRAAGLTIILIVIALRAVGRMEWADAQFLLLIAACLLRIIQMLRGGGNGK